MNTVLVRYGRSVRKKKYTTNPNTKYSVKAEISMKTKLFNDSAKHSTFFCRLRIIATHKDHFVRRPSVRLSVRPSFRPSHFPKLCFAGDTCIPWNAFFTG